VGAKRLHFFLDDMDSSHEEEIEQEDDPQGMEVDNQDGDSAGDSE
jgi:hypothetical protein